MKKTIYFLFLLVPFFGAKAQSPGGVSTNHFKLWLKANSIVAANGAVLGTWSDNSPKGFNATQTYTSSPDSAPNYEDNAVNNINFNPTVLFNGTNQFMNILGSNSNADPAFVSSHTKKYTNYAVLQPDPSYAAGTAASPGKYFFAGTAGTDHFTAADVRNTGVILDSWNNDDNISAANKYQSFPLLITIGFDSVGLHGTRTIYTYGKSVSTNSTGTKATNTGNTNYGIGCQIAVSPHLEFYKGTIAELASFTSVNQAATTDKQKIESYLAIKYGLTLSGENYISSTGVTIWNMGAAGSHYNKNIVAIGRDDNSGLMQMESTSTGGIPTFSNGGLLTVFIGGALTTDNANNTGTFTAGDKSFFFAGCDTTVTCGPQSSPKADVPAGICCRLVEQWYTQINNFTNTDVTLEFNVPACASTGLTAANLRLLVDDDGDFSNAVPLSTVAGAGPALLGLTVTGSVVDITLHASWLYANTGYTDGKIHPYFTLGSVSQSTPLPVELMSFNAQLQDKMVLASWATASEVNNAMFTVEKSQDGVNFEKVADVAGSGTTSQTHYYSTIDDDPFVGLSYYRLKQTDYDGNYSYSTLRPITYYPNDEISLGNTLLSTGNSFTEIISKTAGAATITLYDVTGRKIYSKDQNLVAGVNKVELTSSFTQGVYILHVVSASGNIAQKKILAWK